MESTGQGRSPRVCLALASVAVALSLGVALFTFVSRDRSGFTPESTLDLHLSDSPRDAPSQSSGAIDSLLRVAIAPVISPEASVGLYGELIDYIAGNMGLRAALLRGKNYSEVNHLIRMRQCDMAMVCTYSYVLAEADFGARLLVAPEIDGQQVYHSLLIVPVTSLATGMDDLRNKRFASCDVLSTSGWLYPMTLLKNAGYDTGHFFSEHIISGSHDRSVFAVTSGVADGAAVDSIVFEQMVASDPELKRALKVIHRSPPFGMPPFVVAADLPGDQFAQLQRILLDMRTDAEGQRILKTLGFDGFFLPRDDAYDTVRDLHASWLGRP